MVSMSNMFYHQENSKQHKCLQIKVQVKLINARQNFQNFCEMFPLSRRGKVFRAQLINRCVCSVKTTLKEPNQIQTKPK